MSDEKKESKALDLSKFRVLIVEDYKFISDLLFSCLSEMGVGQILAANDGESAQEKILNYNKVESSSNIDVVVLDWLMPGMGGDELLKWIRSHDSESIKFLPIIICSAYTSRELVEDSRDFGATEVMVKPVSAEKLAMRIQHVIDKPRAFIQSETFFGPDRRRRTEPFKGEDRRKTKAEDIRKQHEQL